MVHCRNYVPMQAILDYEGKVRIYQQYGFVLTKPMTHEDMLQINVSKWVTPAPTIQCLDASFRTAVNSIKGFINVNRTALFLHDTTTGVYQHCNYRKNPHLHILVQSNKSACRDLSKFRSMESTLRTSQVEVFTSKVKCTPDRMLSYMTNVGGKTYLGSNDADLRIVIQNLYNNMTPIDQQTEFNKQITGKRKRSDTDLADSDDEADNDDDNDDGDGASVIVVDEAEEDLRKMRSPPRASTSKAGPAKKLSLCYVRRTCLSCSRNHRL